MNKTTEDLKTASTKKTGGANLLGLDIERLKKEWFSNVRADVISGVLVALALIPEAIAFSIIAGVDPQIGLYASFIIAVMTAIFGGRPGMISGATGAMALLMVTLVANHGLEYLFAASILTGVLQVLFRMFRLSRYLKFVPRPVMTGFVNALAILIFMAQLPQFVGAGWQMYAMVAVSLGIIYGLPRLTKAVPAALVAIVAMTAVAIFTGSPVSTVGDMGALPGALPGFHLPNVPFTLETLEIIFPYAAGLALVGLFESLLTASVVDEMTDTTSCKHREAGGQGMANIVTGFFGGMAGCAMIGQSVINVTSGGRGRLSTLCSGAFLLFFILVLGNWVAQIPMGALVAVMIMVSISTFDWSSLKDLQVMPKSDSIVMVATVGVVVYTHNLAIGVLGGIVLSAIFFARKVAKLVYINSDLSEDGRTRVYRVSGEVFFVSVDGLVAGFDFDEKVSKVKIDLTQSHLWDASAVEGIDRIVLKYRDQGVEVDLVGLNEASETLLDRMAKHNEPDAALGVGH